MSRRKGTAKIDVGVGVLRNMALDAESGALLGSEEALTAKLGISRATLRQAARLLEREGVLRVRRGISGGYFAARPSFNSVEYAFGAYLESLDVAVEDLTMVASLLWVEVVRKAAAAKTQDAKALAEHLLGKVHALRLDASWADVLEFDQYCRTAMFKLIKSRYVELIFNVNIAFGHRRGFRRASDRDGTREHLEFVRAWREATMMELRAITEGDQELAVMAARYMRDLWHRRVWGHPYS
jgi:DNA-binding FadR family transcriptional regulator